MNQIGIRTRIKSAQRNERPEFDYVAYAKCGCIVGLTVDFADKDTGKAVAEWIADGCHIERVTTAQVRELLDTKGFGCKCQPGLF
jgi:hypothetical protein